MQESQRLKGESNYMQWKVDIINIAKSNGLLRYISPEAKKFKPKEVQIWDEKASEESIKKWEAWESGDSTMQLAITSNCGRVARLHTVDKKSALDMWLALETQYQGQGVVLNYNAIVDMITDKYENYSSLESFVISFQSKLAKLKELDIGVPQAWEPILFIFLCDSQWPMWAERQRSLLRSDQTITIAKLVQDLIDEARVNPKSATNGGALYAQAKDKAKHKKDKGFQDKNKSKDIKDMRPCKHCDRKGHKDADCFNVNAEKRQAWEKVTGKSWKSSTKSKKKDQDDSDDEPPQRKKYDIMGLLGMDSDHDRLSDYLMGMPREPNVESNWLFDTGAWRNICNSITRFIPGTYIEGGIGLPTLESANGDVTCLGKGKVLLQLPLPDGTINDWTLHEVYYLPQCPVNLFSGKIWFGLGGYMRYGNLYTSRNEEVAQVNEKNMLFLEDAESFTVPESALPAALEKAPVDIELMHRRLCHASYETVRNTKSVVFGVKFNDTPNINPPVQSRVCEPCEKGRPTRTVRKKTLRDRSRLKALDEINIDVIGFKPRSLTGNHNALLVTDSKTTARWGYVCKDKKSAASAINSFP